MWVEKTKEGRFKFSERYEDPMTGKLLKVSVTMDKDNRYSRKEAARILAEKAEKKKSTLSGPDKKYTIIELIEIYYAHQLRNNALGTAERNHYTLLSVAGILRPDVLACMLTARYVNERFIQSGRTASVLNEYLHRLKSFLRWAYDNDYLQDITWLGKLHPIKDTPHKVRIQDKYLEREELERVVLAMQRYRIWMLLTKFLAFSGLRFGEFCALEKDDVNLDRLVIHVTKSYDSVHDITVPAKTFESIRDVHIQPELLEVCNAINAEMNRRRLLHGVKGCSLFMFNKDGSHINYYAYNKYLKSQAMKLTGKTITPHALRHTHASLLYEAGFTVDEVARRLGHANSSVTREIYLHVTEGLKEKDAKKLDSVRFFGAV